MAEASETMEIATFETHLEQTIAYKKQQESSQGLAGAEILLNQQLSINECQKMLRTISLIYSTATNKELKVDFSTQGTGILAYVQMDRQHEVNCGVDMFLRSQQDVRTIMVHELEHLNTKISDLNLQQSTLNEDHFRILNQLTNQSDSSIEQLDLNEGFTQMYAEIKTENRINNVYEPEKAMARALDAQAKKSLGVSLLTIFHSGRADVLLHLLKKLADHLLLEKALIEQAPNLNPEKHQQVVEEIINDNYRHLHLTSFQAAKDIIAERLAQPEELTEINRILHQLNPSRLQETTQ